MERWRSLRDIQSGSDLPLLVTPAFGVVIASQNSLRREQKLMTLEEAIEIARTQLPHDWRLQLTIGGGRIYGGVEGPGGLIVNLEYYSAEGITVDILEAVAVACGQTPETVKPVYGTLDSLATSSTLIASREVTAEGMNTPQRVQIIAIEKKTGERTEITSLYWFEEEGVHDFDGRGHHYDYDFEIWVDGERVA